MSRFAVAVAAIIMMLGVLYRAWLIRSEAQDLSAFLSTGDTVVQVGSEDWTGGYGTFNIVCRKGSPHHFLVSWRMPCHADKERCPYVTAVPADWHAESGEQLSSTATNTKRSQTSGYKARLESTDDLISKVEKIELGEFLVVRRPYGEILISKTGDDALWSKFLSGLERLGSKFRFVIDEQTSAFVNELKTTRLTKAAKICTQQ